MPHSRHRKRTASASLVSIALHLLVAVFLGVHFNWQIRKRLIKQETAIQVTFHPGDIVPGAPARPILPAPTPAPTPVASESASPRKRPAAQVNRDAPVPTVSLAQAPAVVSTSGVAPQTDVTLAEARTTPLATVQNLLPAEQGTLPATAATPESSGPAAEQPAVDAGDREEDLPSIGEQMHTAMRGIASHIVGGNGSGKLDVVFLLDTSGSMYDNILEVSNQLSYMASTWEQHGLDYRVGLVKFKYAPSSLRIFPMTTDITKFERILRNTTHVGGPERAYDALVEAAARVDFRPDVDRHFVLVTDEPLSGSYSPTDVWSRCTDKGIRVNVIGLKNVFHRKLAEVTGGTWQPIPVSSY